MILLTGGAGYIGSHIAVELLDAGYDVIIADNFSNASADVIKSIETITGTTPAICQIDLTDKSEVERMFQEIKIDAVIHLAGYKAVGESVREPLKYYRNNLDSTLSLLEAMEKHGVTQFVYSSSATVYGDPGIVEYTESLQFGAASSPYGSTKEMCERIITDVAAASELSAVFLRYFNPVGAHKSGLIGDDPDGIPNNLMPFITQATTGKLPELTVFGDDYPTRDGSCIRDYLHVVDLAKGHVSALKYCMDHKGVEAINLGSGRGTSVLELIEAFERVNGVKVPYKIGPRRAGDLAEYYASPAKAEKLMGWKAELTIDGMCRDAWNFAMKAH